MIITIDGYAGSGKSTAARRLAADLGFDLMNTGAMYRAVGLILGRRGIDIYVNDRDPRAVATVVNALDFEMPGDRVLVNGEDVTAAIHTEEMGRAASRVGTFPEVRTRLKAEQRRLADDRDIVCEGRDQGTAVFPDAPVKFFFRASVAVRAERRLQELLARDVPADPEDIRRRIEARDRQDENRPIDPLRKAADAVEIDTSHLTEDDVLRVMAEVVGRCRSTV
jgi:cytidylate kinase